MSEDVNTNQELVLQLREMILQGVEPASILVFLRERVNNEWAFIEHLVAACPDDQCDEGLIWLVASRWFTNNQTPYGANRLLSPIFRAAQERHSK